MFLLTSMDEIGEEKVRSRVQVGTDEFIGICTKAFWPVLHSLDVLDKEVIGYEKDDNIQGVQEKIVFFTIHCKPSLAYIALRDLQRNVSVQSLLLARNFFQ